jgi:hypothetical protein
MGELPPGIDTNNLDELAAALTPSTLKALGIDEGALLLGGGDGGACLTGLKRDLKWAVCCER